MSIIFVTWIFIYFSIPIILYLFLSIISFNDEGIKINVNRIISNDRVY